MPCGHRLIGEPNRDTSSPNQCGIICRPVRQPVSGLRDLVTAAFVEFIGHLDPRRRASDGDPYHGPIICLTIVGRKPGDLKPSAAKTWGSYNSWDIHAPTRSMTPRGSSDHLPGGQWSIAHN